MASPQTKNGFTRIANEIMDALTRTRIPGEARQCLDFIIRKTYGYGKKEDAISLSQFSYFTGLHRSSVCRGINQLVEMKLIYKKATSLIAKYRFNKDFDTWQVVAKVRRGKNATSQFSKSGSRKNANQVVAKVRHTKEILTKETITKDKSKIDFGLAELLKSRLKENNPKVKIPKKLNAWVNDCRLMRERDNRTPDEIRTVIDFSQADPFWQANILSMAKLRAKFDQLWLKAQNNGNGHKAEPPPKPTAKQVIAERRARQ